MYFIGLVSNVEYVIVGGDTSNVDVTTVKFTTMDNIETVVTLTADLKYRFDTPLELKSLHTSFHKSTEIVS
jgi:hypothetical protein